MQVADPEVGFEVPRILPQVILAVELQWIDEERGNEQVAIGPRTVKQSSMSGMQGTHGRHASDSLAVLLGPADSFAEGGNGRYALRGHSP